MCGAGETVVYLYIFGVLIVQKISSAVLLKITNKRPMLTSYRKSINYNYSTCRDVTTIL